VDLDVEMEKAEKKLALARLNLEKVVKVESQPDYDDTVPANVRMVNEEKVWILRPSIGYETHPFALEKNA
jgi:hypothetical protein